MTDRGTKQCALCGGTGHSAHQCQWAKRSNDMAARNITDTKFSGGIHAMPQKATDWEIALAVARFAPTTGQVVVSSALLLDIEQKLSEGRRDAKRLDALERLSQGRGGLLLHTGQDPECVFGVGIGLAAMNQTLREAIDRATDPS